MPILHHEIEKKNRTRPIARLIDLIKPNNIGIKWRFFEFSIILKNSSVDYTFLHAIFYILEFFAAFVPAVYVFSGYIPGVEIDHPPGKAFLPFWKFCNKIIPEFIYIETFLYIQSVLIFFVLLLFFICLMSPKQCYFFHIFLNVHIHLILFPLTCGCFSYDIYYFLFLPPDGAGLVPTIIHFILFFFYFCLIVLLYFVESNTIIFANYGVSHWFSLFPLHFPFLLFFITFTGFEMANFDLLSRHILVFILLIFLISTAVFTFINTPFVLFIGNEIYFSQLLTLVLSFMIDDLMLSDIIYGKRKLIFSMLPVFFIIIYLISHVFFKLRRISLTKIFTNLTENDSFEPLDINIRSASKMCILVKLGIVSGHKIVISPRFVQYCLERFPDNEWFISYVAFLYVVMWSASEDVYKFLLHLLSLDVFNIATQYVLYQFVYCFMQTSQVTSPAIYRKLQKYRQLVLKFVVAHKNFWLAAVEQNYDSFRVANDQMAVLMAKIEFSLKQLKLLYPLCPVIHCERSLFEADFHHNYSKSDLFYKKAAALVDHTDVFINSTFFFHYSLFFPGMQRLSSTKSSKEENMNKEENSSEHCYLSFFENNGDALRSSVSLSIHDTYITSLTHTFHQQKETQNIDPKFDTFSRRAYLSILFIFVGFILAIFIYQTSINRILNRCLDEYEEMSDFLFWTKKFKNDLNIAEFDLLLAINVTAYESFFNFTIQHLESIRKDLIYCKYIYDTAENKNKEAIYLIENSLLTNTSLSIILSKLNTLMFSARSLVSYDNESSVALIETKEVIESFSKAFDFIELVFYDFIDFFVKTEKDEIKKLKIHAFAIIALEIIPFLIGSIICYHLNTKTQNDVFDIIKTGQPPILNYIAHQFDKIILYQKSQYPELKQYRRPTINVPLILMIIFYLLPDIMILATAYQNKITVETSQSFYPVISPTKTALQIYFILGFNQLSRRGKEEDFCIHDFFTSFNISHSIDAKTVKMTFYDHSHAIVVISKIIFIIIIPLLIWFCLNIVNIAKYWKIRKYMLQFIPSRISHSNPIFHELLKEGKVQNTTVKEFLGELKTPPSNFDFFCSLQYSSDETIKKIIGNPKSFLRKVPNSLQELREDLLATFETEADQINEFFDAKILNSCLSLSFKDGKDVSFSFASDPNSLIIKDDQLNSENNLKQRISRHLDDHLLNRRIFQPSTAANSMDKCVLLLLECFEPKFLSEISEKCAPFPSLRVADSRYNRLVIISQVTETVNFEFIDFLNQINQYVKELRGVAVLGGPLTFFDGVKGGMTKSRFVGEVYERAKLILFELEKSEVLIENDVIKDYDNEIKTQTPKEVKIRDGKVIQGILYFE